MNEGYNEDFLKKVRQMKDAGKTEREIANVYGLSTPQLRTAIAIAKSKEQRK